MKSRIHFVSTLFFAIAITAAVNAQVAINEISYNPPESGTDSLEYIELLNTTGFPVNLNGWHFTGGIEDTLPDVVLGAGEFYVVAVSAAAMLNVFGIAVDEWSSGGLNNSGEKIVLVDAGLNIIDSVLFDDSDPWPVLADGSGPSLELIDPGAGHNDPTNWQASGEGTGVIIEGFEVFGTPGAANSGGGTGGPAITIVAEHTVFTPRHAVVAIGDVVRWTNPEAIPHNVNGSQSIYAGNPESIFSGAPATGPWQFDYTTETAGLYNYHCDVHVGQGMAGTLSVYDPNNYTDFPLAHLRLTDQNGSHIFDGVPTRVTGIVYGINFQPSGYSFYIIDENNVGINVFSFDPGTYEVQQGDRVRVSGVIDQFNGLLEIIPDEIEILSQNEPLVSPDEINTVTESNESSHITVSNFSVDSIVATGTSGFNIYATHQNGNPLLIRLDADVSTDTSTLSGAVGVGVIGIGTQFDASFPFTEGYQILALQFFPSGSTAFLKEDAIQLSPNPAGDFVRLQSAINMIRIEVLQLDGKVLLTQHQDTRDAIVDISRLPSGLFIIKATTPEGIWTSKMMVQD